MDQIFNLRMIGEKMITKEKKVYGAFIDLEKAIDRIDWEEIVDVLKMYGVSRRVLSRVKAYYKDVNTCVKKGEWRSG